MDNESPGSARDTPLGAETPSIDDGASRAGSPLDGRAWIPIATPVVVAAVYFAIGLTVGFDVFGPGGAGRDPPVAYALLAVLFLVSLAGTLVLFRDAEETAARTDWTPEPWTFVLVGAGIVAAVGTASFALRGTPPAELVAPAIGLFVVGIAVASVAVGPVYLAVKYRRVGHL